MAELVRETLEAYALRAPSADGLQAAVDARAGRLRGRRRWVTVVGVAAATALVLAGATVLAKDRAPRNVPLVAPADPPGARLLLWHGIEVALPEKYFSRKFDACGAPQADTVLVNDTPEQGDCALHVPRGLTLVQLFGGTGAFGTRDDPYTGPLNIDDFRSFVLDGVPVRRTSARTRNKQYAEMVYVPSRRAVVLVTTDDPAEAKRILDTVRVPRGGFDRRGCAIYEPDVYLDVPPARPEARERMVPDGVVQASVCRNGKDGSPIVSKLVGADEAVALAGVLNQLPAGFAPPTADWSGGSFTVRFRYERGPDVVVRIHRDGPRDVGVTNGAVRGRATDGLGSALRPFVGWQYAYEQERLS